MRSINFQQARRFLTFLIIWINGYQPGYSQGFSPETQAKLQQVIEQFQNDPNHPFIGGISAAINVDGLAIWQGATGYAARNIDGSNNLLPGGTPLTTATLSRIYSVTKTFVAALVLELAKEGKFSLDSPVSDFIPLSLINSSLNSSVTIRQLLAHESGYSDFTDNINFQIAVAFQPTRVWTPYEVLYFASQVDQPGVIRKYSSTNYIVLGAIVEAVTHKPVEQYFRERFFDPLHLKSMYLAGRESIGNRGTLASPHDNISALNQIFQLTGQPTFPDAYTNIQRLPFTAIESIAFTSGGIVSNVADVAEWGNDLFGGRATSESTIQQMIQSISSTPDEDGDYLGYGLWRSTKISSTDVFIGHDGNATGYRSVMFYQPDKKLTIAILTNFHGANLYDIAKTLYQALPDFTCGNKDEAKIQVCWKGKTLCVARPAAGNLIEKGAYLGACESTTPEKVTNSIENTIQNNKKINGLLIAYPNPFSEHVTISFTAPQSGNTRLNLYNSNGQLVKAIFSGFLAKGQTKELSLEREKLASGTYIVKLEMQSRVSQQKLVVSR